MTGLDQMFAPVQLDKLVPWTDESITQRCAPFDFSRGEGARHEAGELQQRMINVMKDRKGLGLSAVQIGVPVSAFVLGVEPAECVFNPRVVDATQEGTVMEEACLTFTGLAAKVWRPNAIKVRFQTWDGETHTQKYAGMTARVFLHEYDHCVGRVFFDRLEKMALTMEVKRAAKRGFAYPIGKLWQISQRSRANSGSNN